MKMTAVQMSKTSYLLKLINKLFLQRNKILLFLTTILISGSSISGAITGSSIFAACWSAAVQAHGICCCNTGNSASWIFGLYI